MKFVELLMKKQANLYGERQPTVAFLGDSVTHGCFEIFLDDKGIQTSVRVDEAYHEKFRDIINTVYPTVPITIINAGISGDSARMGTTRLQRDVLSYNPDLVVVCYGLNDCQHLEEGIPVYKESLCKIFAGIKNSGAEVIFLTPNLITEKLDVSLGNERLDKCLEGLVEKKGWLEKYMKAAREASEESNVPVCDCNKIWEMLREKEVDINSLLSNRANHPTEKMHWLFAYELVRKIFMD